MSVAYCLTDEWIKRYMGHNYAMLDIPRGWECPKCGVVWSPIVQQCLDCKEKQSERPERVND